MKKLILFVILAAILGVQVKDAYKIYKRREYIQSDAYARKHVVLIESSEGSCTGVKVQAPSGKRYILTASHCRLLGGKAGVFKVKGADGIERKERLVQDSNTTDLMLLTNSTADGVQVAGKTELFEKVHTMTHGKGRPAYRTDGELLAKERLTFPVFPIADDKDVKKCNKPKNFIMFDIFNGLFCAVQLELIMGTAAVVPGSSGGPLFNVDNELAGIVSATDGFFGAYVDLDQIKKFLEKR